MKTWPFASTLLAFCFSNLLTAQVILSGHVLNVTHHPIPDAKVLLYHAGTGQLIQTACTDMYGRFEVEINPSGTYYMAIKATDYETFCTEPVVPVTPTGEKDLGPLILWKATAPHKKSPAPNNIHNTCYSR